MKDDCDLEKKCRELVQQGNDSDGSPSALVRQEMRFILSQVDAVRKHGTEMIERLDRQRLEIEGKILNLEPRFFHSTDIWLERNRLRNQLLHTLARLEQQFQHVASDTQKTVLKLQSRLSELWNMHQQLQSADDSDLPS